MLRSAIMIPEGAELDRWLSSCAALADLHGWEVEGLYRSWEELAEQLCARQADIGIVGTRAHLPPDRIPRVEVVEDQPRPLKLIPLPRDGGESDAIVTHDER